MTGGIKSDCAVRRCENFEETHFAQRVGSQIVKKAS
jgi:hypothetical protein